MANVCVGITDAPLLPPVPNVETALERKRRAIWHNEQRNNLVAAIATACASRDMARLWGQQLFLDDEEFPIAAPGPGWISVLVESPEHARELAKSLPGWMIGVADGNIGQRDRTPTTLPAPWRSIDTLLAAYEAENYNPDVVIVASCHWLGVLDNFGHAGALDQQIIIDIADDFDTLAEQATWNRIAAYTDRRWDVRGPSRWTPPTAPNRTTTKTRAQQSVEKLCNVSETETEGKQ